MIKATKYLFRNCLEKTAGVSLRIDEYLSYCGEVSELLKIRQHHRMFLHRMQTAKMQTVMYRRSEVPMQ